MVVGAWAGDVMKIGIIGLDTSHSTAFTELLNGDDMSDPYVRDFEVVAAYPYGSKTIESSYNRIPGYIEEVKKHGVKITESIAELLDIVCCLKPTMAACIWNRPRRFSARVRYVI